MLPLTWSVLFQEEAGLHLRERTCRLRLTLRLLRSTQCLKSARVLLYPWGRGRFRSNPPTSYPFFATRRLGSAKSSEMQKHSVGGGGRSCENLPSLILAVPSLSRLSLPRPAPCHIASTHLACTQPIHILCPVSSMAHRARRTWQHRETQRSSHPTRARCPSP